MNTSKVGDKIIISSNDQYFDDCPICQAMRKADKKGKNLDPMELAEAFDEANKNAGAIVRGIPEVTRRG